MQQPKEISQYEGLYNGLVEVDSELGSMPLALFTMIVGSFSMGGSWFTGRFGIKRPHRNNFSTNPEVKNTSFQEDIAGEPSLVIPTSDLKNYRDWDFRDRTTVAFDDSLPIEYTVSLPQYWELLAVHEATHYAQYLGEEGFVPLPPKAQIMRAGQQDMLTYHLQLHELQTVLTQYVYWEEVYGGPNPIKELKEFLEEESKKRK